MHKYCRNLLQDFDSNGNLKTFKDKDGNIQPIPPRIIPIKSIEDLNKMVGTDPDGWANLKAYVNLLKEKQP